MKIALIGYGKMGKEIEKIALSRGHEIVSIIDINNQEDFESDAFKSADVAIEFSNPMVAYNNYMKAFKAGVKLYGLAGGARRRGQETLYRRRQNTVLVIKLQFGSSHILGGQQISGKNYEPLPRLRRNDERNAPHT